MLRQMVLGINLENAKDLVCTHGYIWGKWIEAAYTRKATGEGETFRERNQVRVSCTVCGVAVESSYLKGHMVRQHGRRPTQTREVEIGGGGLQITYVVSIPRVLKTLR